MKKQNSKYFALVFILIASQACSSGGTAAEPTGVTTTAIPEASETTPTEIAGPLPSGYMELFNNKVASGEWTEEEGLVTLLKMFIGEIQVSEVDLGQGVLQAEGTGILRLATGYLQTGTDQAVKDEITRLLNLLVPSQEALDRYSIPAEQAGGRLPGLAAPARQDPEECNLLWTSGFPDASSPAFPCFLFDKQNIAGNWYWVYYPLAWRGVDSLDQYYTATLQAVQKAITLYQTYGTVQSIYFVFSTLPDVRDTLEWTIYASTDTINFRPAVTNADGTVQPASCPVVINPSALALEISEYKQAIAHEIFHCFQAWNLRDQLNGPGEDNAWWVEGTAEYFSNLVYPAVNAEHEFWDDFNELSKIKPLTNLSYEDFVFFQFWGNRIGADGVIATLRTMPTRPGREAQLAALAAVSGMEETFEEFVRSILDKTLIDSDGSNMGFDFDFNEEFSFTDNQYKDFSSNPFIFSRFLVNFDSVAVETLSDGVGRSAWRASESVGGWGPFPATAASGCEVLSYILYVITTTPDVVRTETAMVTDAPCDDCLIGRWEATNDSMLSYMQSVISVGDDAPTVESTSGVAFMEFDANGTGAGGYEDFNVNATGVGGNEANEVLVNFEGFSSGPFTADGDALIGLSETTDMLVTVQGVANGVSFSSTVPFGPDDFPVNSTISTAYSCDGDSLTTWPPAEGVEPIEWIHVSP
jgi:hypothetical protein